MTSGELRAWCSKTRIESTSLNGCYTELNESYVKAGKFTPEEFAKHQAKKQG